MREETIDHRYDDIIHLHHHQSKTRPHMPISDRAAQFSPFAALTGYEDAVKDAARLTDSKLELTEEELIKLSTKLVLLKEKIKDRPEVVITYFVADNKKAGGTYLTEMGVVKKLDEFRHIVIMENGTTIPIDDIVSISFRDKMDE